jgi:hypothetical protein
MPEISWLNLEIDMPPDASTIQMTIEFASRKGAEGLLSVYLDGQLLLSVDERFSSGPKRVIAGVTAGIEAGPHVLGLRLDTFTSVEATVNVSNLYVTQDHVGPPCTADVTNNGTVDVDDLITVILDWGPCPPPPSGCPADIAPTPPNGEVDVDDLIAVILGWGACP